MPRRWIKSVLPDPQRTRDHKWLRFFGRRLHDPQLWHLSRRSVAGGLSAGVFSALVPIPFQMVLAGFLALWLRVNLPLAVATVWLTNPVTIPPIFYTTYRFGAWLLNSEPLNLQFQLSWDWLSYNLAVIWQPLLLGSLTIGLLLAAITYLLVSLAWRWYVVAARRRPRPPPPRRRTAGRHGGARADRQRNPAKPHKLNPRRVNPDRLSP